MRFMTKSIWSGFLCSSAQYLFVLLVDLEKGLTLSGGLVPPLKNQVKSPGTWEVTASKDLKLNPALVIRLVCIQFILCASLKFQYKIFYQMETNLVNLPPIVLERKMNLIHSFIELLIRQYHNHLTQQEQKLEINIIKAQKKKLSGQGYPTDPKKLGRH